MILVGTHDLAGANAFIPMDGLITYEGTHSLGRRAPRELADQVAAWLARFGYGPEPSDAGVLLDVRGDGDDPALTRAQNALSADYGAYPQRRATRGPDGDEWSLYRWSLDARAAGGSGGVPARVPGKRVSWPPYRARPDDGTRTRRAAHAIRISRRRDHLRVG